MEDFTKHLTILNTADGSATLYSNELNETYHSSKGAYTESVHVFIQNGLRFFLESHAECRVLEVGFGTGLNTILAYQTSQELNKKIFYVGLEPFPLDISIIKQLRYENVLPSLLWNTFYDLHQAPWNIPIAINSQFIIEKNTSPLENYYSVNQFDVVFFDAFAPKKQPSLWIPERFEQLYSLMSVGGVLVSYCVCGSFRRALLQAGFKIEKLPGPPGGKREMLRAWK
ncbi:MAG: tRNA (5-methylaminomethyl-2-thiouridine)(34)-methyltransferase MnmD [Cytophagales bacterium]|nr:tRNA (5-methylaminomethyl-2-thiouridine)(34)-methyltransferase MnmD [Cytophagales bacterium]MDW8384003.1 tRNA (5-methylaminomethyl-2-thiouridine)(34)-methyltransferase MnmD [Flammeovirgaceae bacterium]